MAFLYLNLVGGQDELVFDGCSFATDAAGSLVQRAPAFDESLSLVDVTESGGALRIASGPIAALPVAEESVWRAIVHGVRDYVGKHQFSGVVIGLSGGVDSALVLALACDALGADRVQAVMMPSRHTAAMSRDDAAAMARGLGVKYSVIPIEDMYAATIASLAERIQGPRCGHDRGEHPGALPRNAADGDLEQDRTHGADHRQQERNVGRLRDALRRHGGRLCADQGLQQDARLAARAVAERARPGAGDPGSHHRAPADRGTARQPARSDTLPPYDVLDPILEAFIEDNRSVDEIVELGFERATVTRVLEMVKRNEYKRRQAPPGVRVSGRAFGRDWRYPITSGYRPGES